MHTMILATALLAMGAGFDDEPTYGLMLELDNI